MHGQIFSKENINKRKGKVIHQWIAQYYYLLCQIQAKRKLQYKLKFKLPDDISL